MDQVKQSRAILKSKPAGDSRMWEVLNDAAEGSVLIQAAFSFHLLLLKPVYPYVIHKIYDFAKSRFAPSK